MVLRRYAFLFFVLLGAALAQSEKPLLAGGTLLKAVYPGGFGVSYVEAEPFARALGLAFWQDDGQLILGLGPRRIRFVVTPLPRSKTLFKKVVTSKRPPALQQGSQTLVPLRFTARALGAVYSGSESSLRVLLPEAEIRSLRHAVKDGRDVVSLRLTRDVNATAEAAAGGWWLLGVRVAEQLQDVQGLYLNRLRLEPGPYGARIVLEGAASWPVEVAYFPTEVRFYVGPKPGALIRRKRFIVIDPGHGGSDFGVRYGSLSEKEIVLKVAREAANRLRRSGYEVVLTRNDDRDVSDYQRAHWAARADVYIAVHLSGSSTLGGPVIYRYTAYGSDVPVFVARARTLLDRGGYRAVLRRFVRSAGEVASFSDIVEEEFGRIGLTSRRAETPLYVLEHAPGAALLIELGSLANATDRARLANAAQQSAYAQVIVRAVEKFLGGSP